MITFTGFWEAKGADTDEMSATITHLDTDELLARLKARMEACQPGTRIRIDLIAWDE